MYLITKLNRKWFLISGLLMNGIAMFTFTLTKNVGFLYFNRIIIGLCEALISIYSPVWVDQYGARNRKTIMMSLLEVTSPLGVVVGYVMTSLLIKSDIYWGWSFIIQAILSAVFVVFIFFLPNIYFSHTLRCINPIEPVVASKKKKEKEEFNQILEDLNKRRQEEEHDRKATDVVSIFQHGKVEEGEAANFWKALCKLLKVRVFMLCVIALSIIFFISTVVQYWVSDYMKKELKLDADTILIAFVVTCVTGPTLGIIIGGCVVHKFGGYESKNALIIVCIYGIGAVACSIPVTQFNSLWGFAVFLWLFLFFGGCIVPNLAGIVLTVLPADLKGPGNSVLNFFKLLVGFLPAPYVYGLIYEETKDTTPRLALGFCLIYSTVALVLTFAAMLCRNCDFKKLEQALDKDSEQAKEEGKSKTIQELELFKSSIDVNEKKYISSHNGSIVRDHSDNADINNREKEKEFIKTSLSARNQIRPLSTNVVNPLTLDSENQIKYNTAGIPKKNHMEYEQISELPENENDNDNINNNSKPIFNNSSVIKNEDILFKGENGNEEIYEVKLKKSIIEDF